jgi:hypothetical protein
VKAPRIMVIAPCIMVKAPRIMPKAPRIMPKEPRIMLKAPNKMSFDHLRQLWLSICTPLNQSASSNFVMLIISDETRISSDQLLVLECSF